MSKQQPQEDTPRNAKAAIASLLATQATRTSPGSYCTGGELPSGIPTPKIHLVMPDKNKSTCPLSFPLSKEGVSLVKDRAERADVGMSGGPSGDRNGVNLDVRTSWQIKPDGLEIVGDHEAKAFALNAIQSEILTGTDYHVEAHLYKLLLYETGCFFHKHRDTERLEGMFGTMVLELPSEYEGAALNIWSPLTPSEKATYAFGEYSKAESKTEDGGPNAKRPRLAPNNKKMKFTAFYADCYHEVTELTQGYRLVLVYHLTASPKPRIAKFRHLPDPLPLVPQPASENVAIALANLMEQFGNESDKEYAGERLLPLKEFSNYDTPWPEIKPDKLVIVLSHQYTPSALREGGWNALKGTDRSIAELIRAGACHRRSGNAVFADGTCLDSLQKLAAKAVIENNPEEYQASTQDDIVHTLLAEALDGEEKEGARGPNFDAVLALAVIHDYGEFTADMNPSSYTTGPLYWLANDGAPFDIGPLGRHELRPDYHPAWFDEGKSYWGPYRDEEDIPLDYADGEVYGCSVWPSRPGNHSLLIESHEVLFASKAALKSHQAKSEDHGRRGLMLGWQESAKSIEFLGNSCPYPGRHYSRAVIVLWPKSHQKKIQQQTLGGAVALGAQSD